MKCLYCNGTGDITKNNNKFRQTSVIKLSCPHCKGTGIEPPTNEEWLRTLPADERVKEVLSRGFMTEKRTAEEFVEWLKEIHDDNNT